jgi:hypothetical protein
MGDQVGRFEARVEYLCVCGIVMRGERGCG